MSQDAETLEDSKGHNAHGRPLVNLDAIDQSGPNVPNELLRSHVHTTNQHVFIIERDEVATFSGLQDLWLGRFHTMGHEHLCICQLFS